jgi:hypothetical protein
MEALTVDARIPGDSSSLTLNSDLKLSVIRCKRLKEPIIVEDELAKESKIAKKRSSPREFVF